VQIQPVVGRIQPVVGRIRQPRPRRSRSSRSSLSSSESCSPSVGRDLYTETDKGYQCLRCKRIIRLKCNMECHVRIHTGERPYRCKYCNKTFTQLATLQRHNNLHSGIRPYACTICNNSFVQSASLMAHLRVHQGDKPWKCTFCGRQFNQKNNLRIHYTGHHAQLRRFSCSICNKRFFLRLDVQRHAMRAHKNRSLLSNDYIKEQLATYGSNCKHCNLTFTSHASFFDHFYLTTYEGCMSPSPICKILLARGQKNIDVNVGPTSIVDVIGKHISTGVELQMTQQPILTMPVR